MITSFPSDFLNQMQHLLKEEEKDAFVDAFSQPVPVSLRRNPQKLFSLLKKWSSFSGIPTGFIYLFIPTTGFYTLDYSNEQRKNLYQMGQARCLLHLKFPIV